MTRLLRSALAFLGLTLSAQAASAVASAELYPTAAYRYGRFEARIRYAAGDGVVSSFFLWKDGSEVSGTFWNELDFEKLGDTCWMQTNTLYGTPVSSDEQKHTMPSDMCDAYHDYSFEWTPTYIAWFIDGMEIRRETGAVATAFADNAPAGMQIRFNVWPGTEDFGGNFNPAILPVRQYISWVQYSSYRDGNFERQWREEFDGSSVPNGWATGNWESPYGRSTHNPQNVAFVNGIAVLSLTSDQATGFTGMPPADASAGAPNGGASGSGGRSAGGAGGAAAGSGAAAGAEPTAGAANGGAAAAGASNGGAATAGSSGAAALGGSAGSGTAGSSAPGSGAPGSGAPGNGAGGSGAAPTGSAGTGAPAVAGSPAAGGGIAGSGMVPNGTAGANGAGSPATDSGGDDGGCGCSFADSRRGGLGLVSAALLGLAALRRRRRAG